MIRICDNCSNVNVEAIIEIVGEANVEVGCMSQCGQNMDAASILVDEELHIADDEQGIIELVKSL